MSKVKWGILLLLWGLTASGVRVNPLTPEELHSVLYPVLIPERAEDVDLSQFVHPAVLHNFVVEAKPVKIPSDGHPRWRHDAYRCWILGKVHWVYQATLSEPPPKSISELLTGPYSLWIVREIQERPYTLHWEIGIFGHEVGYLAPKKDLESYAATGKPGDAFLFERRAFPESLPEGKFWGIVCTYNAYTRSGDGSFLYANTSGFHDFKVWGFWEHKYGFSGPSGRMEWAKTAEEELVHLFWSSIAMQFYYAISIYYDLHRQLPTNLDQLDEVVGPRNEKVWNPVIERFGREILARTTLEVVPPFPQK
ncbi:MAG: hypothetical protein V2G48_07860 [bacterium JZ-2024 1]